jgi:hypothetical protein
MMIDELHKLELQGNARMSYTYRANGGLNQRAERHRQKLQLGILAYRKAAAALSCRMTALHNQRDQEIAQAIWDGVSVQSVATAAAMTPAKARSIGLAYEDLASGFSSVAARLETIRVLTEQVVRLDAEKEELRRQQEQLVLTALKTAQLEAPWLAALSGLSIERVNTLAQQKHRN